MNYQRDYQDRTRADIIKTEKNIQPGLSKDSLGNAATFSRSLIASIEEDYPLFKIMLAILKAFTDNLRYKLESNINIIKLLEQHKKILDKNYILMIRVKT